MGSNREVIEDSPEVGTASDVDVQTEDQAEDTDDVLLSEDSETEEPAQEEDSAQEIEKENARGRARGRAGSRASGREAGDRDMDATRLYLSEIGFSPLLTAEEEVYFARLSQKAMLPGSHLKRTQNSARMQCSHRNSSRTSLSRGVRPTIWLVNSWLM